MRNPTNLGLWRFRDGGDRAQHRSHDLAIDVGHDGVSAFLGVRQFLRLVVNGFRTGGQSCAQFGALKHRLEQPNGVKVRGKDENAGKHDRYEACFQGEAL